MSRGKNEEDTYEQDGFVGRHGIRGAAVSGTPRDAPLDEHEACGKCGADLCTHAHLLNEGWTPAPGDALQLEVHCPVASITYTYPKALAARKAG